MKEDYVNGYYQYSGASSEDFGRDLKIGFFCLGLLLIMGILIKLILLLK